MYREQLTHAVAPRPRKKWIHPHLLFFSKSNYPAIPQTILLQPPPLPTHTQIRKHANHTKQDKATGASLGYGFVRFLDRRCALVALQYLNVRATYTRIGAFFSICVRCVCSVLWLWDRRAAAPS